MSITGLLKYCLMVAVIATGTVALPSTNQQQATAIKPATLTILTNKGVTKSLLLDEQKQNAFYFIWNTKQLYQPRQKPQFQYRISFNGIVFNYHANGYIQVLKQLKSSDKPRYYRVTAVNKFNQLLQL